MKLTIEVDITDCRDCMFKSRNIGHGECWDYCSHKDSGRKPYDDILYGCGESFTKTPEWCPLGLGRD